MPSVFVTTGATVPFTALTDLVLEPRFLDALSNEGYDHLTVQYGKSDEGLEHYTDSVGRLSLSSGLYKGSLRVEGIPFSDDVQSLISRVELVISHAGTGSILDALRLKKKLIVVINDKLMGNHQEEVADELHTGGYLIKTYPTLDDLLSSLELFNSQSFKTLSEPKTDTIETILHDL